MIRPPEYGNILITPPEYGNINSSIVNTILYAIWYDMLNIANIGVTESVVLVC